jgi:integrase
MSERISITRRADGRCVTTLQVNGTRKFVYGQTEKEVRSKVSELRRQAASTGTLPTPARRTVDTLLDAWLDAVSPRLKPKSIAIYQGLADRHIRPTLGKVQLARLRPAAVQSLYSQLREQGHVQTPSHVHVVLHAACALAVRWGWLAYNPCDRVIAPRYVAPRRQVWTATEAATFFAAIGDERDGPLLTFLLLIGARIGEALALRWEDLDGATVTIRRTVQHLKRQWVTTPAKTHASERRVALSASAVAALKMERSRQAARHLAVGARWEEAGLVFSDDRGRTLHRHVVARRLRQVCKRLGLDPIKLHDLRHLSASLLLAEGVPLPNVSRRLGHANRSITARIYSHVVQPDASVADVLDRRLRAPADAGELEAD